ncbi:hypothetical protein B0H16DRAFT_1749778 [Mycena metata]|uniref:Uncharacterized protein n=1 Tax=Mycena metata TaxID=1033252 RepID=A0AAD7DRQ9_9AGAR|nr:hypothetical protein B0H16DRAFT_1749778 [Mycena metata]
MYPHWQCNTSYIDNVNAKIPSPVRKSSTSKPRDAQSNCSGAQERGSALSGPSSTNTVLATTLASGVITGFAVSAAIIKLFLHTVFLSFALAQPSPPSTASSPLASGDVEHHKASDACEARVRIILLPCIAPFPAEP